MSGIAGILHLDGQPVSPQAICRMSAAIAHRGPDASGALCDGIVGLAHRMLWTTPESVREAQPMVHRTGDWVLVADARLDNRDDLLAALRVSRAAEISDAELILRAYERWGASCPERLLGDFAFAVWDRHARRLFCARDPMGVKPFYYFQSDRLFAFASEVKALLSLPEVPRVVDAYQVGLYLEGTMEDRERTLYEGIHRLPAAHSMVVDPQHVRRARYWSLDATRELRFTNDGQYAEAFREIFQDAVRVRLRSAHPVGAALSGGLDSSAIVCMARHIQRSSGHSNLHTFSLVFPSLPERELRLIDERQFIDSVVRGGGLTPTFIRGDELTPLGDVQPALRHLDEPYAAPNLYLHWGLYRAARERGARVFLDGFDGDTAVSHGFGRLDVLASSGRWDAFEAEVRALCRHREMHPAFVLAQFGLPYLEQLARAGRWFAWGRTARELTSRFQVSRRATLINHGVRPALPPALRAAYRAIRGLTSEPQSVLARSLALAQRAQRAQRRNDAREDRAGAQVTEREAHLQGLAQPAYQLTLEMADKSAAAFGLEPRYPFFDRRLIEFCLALPAEQKLAGGWSRLVFRRAMEGILPPEVQWRSNKSNLSPNFHRTLRASPAAALDHAAEARLAPYVDIGALRAMGKRYEAGGVAGTRSNDGHVLFRTIVLAHWLLEFSNEGRADGRRISPSAVA